MSIPNAFFKRIRTMVWLTAVILTLSMGVHARAEVPGNVLVLHTYHQGWEWTDRITDGIQAVFQPFGKDFTLYFEYLDVGRSIHEADFERLAEFYRFKLAHIRFQVIIAAGDGALRFTRTHGARLFPGVPVVFCAVTPSIPEIHADGLEIGVVAKMDHYATLDVMLAMHPECRRIVVLIDPKALGRGALRMLETQALVPLAQRVTVDIWADPVWEELPARLVALGPGDLVYLLAFDYDRSFSDPSAAEAAQLVTRWSPVPVYSSLGFYLGKGIVGGMITSGVHQGEQAGQMALRILSGEHPGEMPMIGQSPNRLMFDGRALRRFQMKSSQLPPGSIVIHPEPDFRERHAPFFLYVAGGTILVSLLLCAAFLRQKRKERLLAEMNAALDGRVREKSAQLQLVHQKLKKQTLVDGVTGLPNRRHAYQRFVEEVKKAQRYHHSLSIILIDIDWLKGINLEHGYAVGDTILRDVAQTIRRTVREIDLVGRFGGEEFLVILPDTAIGQCRQTAERIQKAVAELRWEQGEVLVTVSAGLAQLENQAPADLLKLVSDRLADTKTQGVGRIVGA